MHYKGIGQPIVAPYYKDSELARIVLTGDQLIKNRIGLGIYLIDVTDGNKSIRFIRELREVENPQEIYVIIPKLLSDAFKHRQRVRVALTKLNRDGFFQLVKDSIAKKYNLESIEMKDDKLSMQIEGKKLEFDVLNYRYQQQFEYTGAYISLEGPLPAKEPFKIVYDGFGEPSFLIQDGKNKHRTIQSISYDIELLLLQIKYIHDKARVHTKTIRLGKPISYAIEMNQYIERYFQAKSEGIPSRMGAAGTSIAVKALEDMSYKIIWADTITGTKKGPDISLFDNHGNKITAEVKSTSIIADYNHRLNEAINDIETYYFDLNHPERKFLWHTENNKLRYEADYALAVAIYLDEYYKTVDIKMRRIDVVISEGEAKFNRTILIWRTEHIG